MTRYTAVGLLLVCLFAPISLGAIVPFALDLTWETNAPDGNLRKMVYMNGQFPGPTLFMNYGDQVEFAVTNRLPQEATIHFHGIEQSGTPWSDGVPGVSQKPIQTGDTFIYNWTATQYGTYWYHGHARGLVQDGLYGAIHIHPPPKEEMPFALISNDSKQVMALKAAEALPQAVMLSDWTKYTSEEYLASEQASNLDLFCVDSILVNGKGSVNCQPQDLLNKLTNPNLGKILAMSNLSISDKGCTPLNPKALTEGMFTNTDTSKVLPNLQEGCVPTNGSMETIYVDRVIGWANLNFISAMSSKAVIVSIDEHPMWIYAVDGVYIEPQLADTLFMYNGERYSAMIQLNKPAGNYTIRVANNLPDQIISGYATMSYMGVHNKTTPSKPAINYAGLNTTADVRPLNETLLVPYKQSPPAPTADQTFILSMGRYGSNWQWTMNNKSSYALALDNQHPVLFAPNASLHSPLIIATRNNTWVDVILQATLGPQNPAQPPHPMHKHSNKAYIIGRGDGPFNYSSVAEAQKYIPEAFNIEKAQLRDSFTTAAILQQPAWLAFRYHVVNPGAWLLHCHIQTHLNGGMALTILDGVDAWPDIPEEYLGYL